MLTLTQQRRRTGEGSRRGGRVSINRGALQQKSDKKTLHVHEPCLDKERCTQGRSPEMTKQT